MKNRRLEINNNDNLVKINNQWTKRERSKTGVFSFLLCLYLFWDASSSSYICICAIYPLLNQTILTWWCEPHFFFLSHCTCLEKKEKKSMIWDDVTNNKWRGVLLAFIAIKYTNKMVICIEKKRLSLILCESALWQEGHRKNNKSNMDILSILNLCSFNTKSFLIGNK